MQTLNKNGIPVQTKESEEKRRKLKRQAERIKRMQALEDKKLDMKRFALINDEAEVEVVVPHFSPIVELLKGDGWREVF
ncbi:MAG: hypothetical protein ABS960_00745 [Solibacillus isronensis]